MINSFDSKGITALHFMHMYAWFRNEYPEIKGAYISKLDVLQNMESKVFIDNSRDRDFYTMQYTYDIPEHGIHMRSRLYLNGNIVLYGSKDGEAVYSARLFTAGEN